MSTPEQPEHLDTAAVAREYGVCVQTVRRWIAVGVRVGSVRVRLYPVRVVGSRTTVTRETLTAFERACARARFGDEADHIAPPQSVADRAKERKAAQRRTAELLGGSL